MIRKLTSFVFGASLLLCTGCVHKPLDVNFSCKELGMRHSELSEKILQHIKQQRFAGAIWGIKVVSLDTGATLFEHNAEKCLTPGSTVKLFTCALALRELGPESTIKTSLYVTAKPADGIVKGDLLVYGRGDPTIGARCEESGFDNSLEKFVDCVDAAGIKKIEGDLIGDDSFFITTPWASGAEWKDLQEYYGAESSALSVYENSLDIIVKPGVLVGEPCSITTDPATNYMRIVNKTVTTSQGMKTRVRVYRPLAENTVYVIGCMAIQSNETHKRSIAVHNPTRYFMTVLKDALVRRGIEVTGSIKTVDPYRGTDSLHADKLIDIGNIESPPIKDIVKATLKRTQNMCAQTLLLLVGAREKASEKNGFSLTNILKTVSNYSDVRALIAGKHVQTRLKEIRAEDLFQTTEERGIAQLTAFVKEIGIPDGAFFTEEGAGLSRKNLVTPEAVVTLLTYMHDHEYAGLFEDALPVAGVDGTLKTRMKDSAAEKRVHAKTGTMRFVSALSGYVTTAAGEQLAFSILLNNYFNPGRGTNIREDVDVIPVWIAEK